jgi:hypothetical protein
MFFNVFFYGFDMQMLTNKKIWNFFILMHLQIKNYFNKYPKL